MTDVALTAAQQTAVQRRTVLVLSFGQVLGGIAFGATVSHNKTQNKKITNKK